MDAQKTQPAVFASTKDLTASGSTDVRSTFERMASLLQGSGIVGKIQFQLLEGDQPRTYAIQLGRKQFKVHTKSVQKPDLEIIVSEETWWEIAKGRVSPLEVFVRGKMRVRGNHKLGAKIASSLATKPGRTSIC